MRPHVQTTTGQELTRAHMIEETERSEVFARQRRQDARDGEAVDVSDVPSQHRFEDRAWLWFRKFGGHGKKLTSPSLGERSPELEPGCRLLAVRARLHQNWRMPSVIEAASSGRAKCRVCGQAILKGQLRFGEALPNAYGE